MPPESEETMLEEAVSATTITITISPLLHIKTTRVLVFETKETEGLDSRLCPVLSTKAWGRNEDLWQELSRETAAIS